MMAGIITIKLRLRDKHCVELNRQARAVNYVFNYCNETQQKAVMSGRKWLSKYDLQKLTAGASKELNIHSHTIKQVCFWYEYSRKTANKAWLRFRGYKSLGWIPYSADHVKIVDNKTLKFRGVEYEPMHWRYELDGVAIRAGSFNQDGCGKWYVNLTIDAPKLQASHDKPIGLDLGLKSMVTDSEGMSVKAPQFYRRSEKSLATAQRARKSKRTKAIHRKIANRRKDHLHKLSAKIAAQHNLIVVGDVSSSKLARTKMAKSVLDAGWYSFKQMLRYKAIRHGGEMVEVNEAWTTQTCSCCGTRPDSRPKGIAGLSKRMWTCSNCGTVHDRDVNAAKNILRIGLDTLVAGS